MARGVCATVARTRVDANATPRLVRGETQRLRTQAVVRMQSRGVAPRFTDQCSMSGQQWCYGTHIETLAVWRGVAQALAHSGIPEDRTMAMAIVDFVQHMPARQLIPALPDSSRPPSAHIVTAPSRTGISPTSREDSAVSMTGQPNLIRHLTETDTTLSVHALDGSRVSCGGAAGDWHRVKRRRPSV